VNKFKNEKQNNLTSPPALPCAFLEGEPLGRELVSLSLFGERVKGEGL
jgi:hypothetical protein